MLNNIKAPEQQNTDAAEQQEGQFWPTGQVKIPPQGGKSPRQPQSCLKPLTRPLPL